MKQFNLDEYLANPSRPLVTRDGLDVRIICTNRENSVTPIVALVKERENILEDTYEVPYYYYANGSLLREGNDPYDLFFADGDVCKHTAWINLREDPDNLPGNPFALPIYSTAKEAQEAAKDVEDYNHKQGEKVKYRSVKIEWEE